MNPQISGLGKKKKKEGKKKKKKEKGEREEFGAHVLQVDGRDFVHILKAHDPQVDSRDFVLYRGAAVGSGHIKIYCQLWAVARSASKASRVAGNGCLMPSSQY